MPERLIDANELCNELNDEMMLETYNDYKKICEALKNAPTVDAVRVVHGKWDADPCGWHCTECGADGRASWHYCPNCGAKMDGEKGEKE